MSRTDTEPTTRPTWRALLAAEEPLLLPAELHGMVAYPTSLIFRVTHTIEKAPSDMKAGRLTLANEGVGFDAFKSIAGYGEWTEIGDRFGR